MQPVCHSIFRTSSINFALLDCVKWPDSVRYSSKASSNSMISLLESILKRFHRNQIAGSRKKFILFARLLSQKIWKKSGKSQSAQFRMRLRAVSLNSLRNISLCELTSRFRPYCTRLQPVIDLVMPSISARSLPCQRSGYALMSLYCLWVRAPRFMQRLNRRRTGFHRTSLLKCLFRVVDLGSVVDKKSAIVRGLPS